MPEEKILIPWDELSDQQKKIWTFARISRDLNFEADMVEVCRISSIVLKCIPADFWFASDFNTLRNLANGTHPFYEKYVI
jgi:hypothetical protein